MMRNSKATVVRVVRIFIQVTCDKKEHDQNGKYVRIKQSGSKKFKLGDIKENTHKKI